MNGCFICEAATAQVDVPWTDAPLLREPGVGIVIPGTGALVPGYLLACPEQHVRSLAEVRQSSVPGFAKLVERTQELLLEAFGPTLMFEHGSCAIPARQSGCVDHAHLHIWSIADRVKLSAPFAGTKYESFGAFLRDGHRWRGAPYLLYSDPGCTVHVSQDHGEPQFFRRQVAVGVGRADEWDYAFRFEAEMKETINRVRPLIDA